MKLVLRCALAVVLVGIAAGCGRSATGPDRSTFAAPPSLQHVDNPGQTPMTP